MVVRTLKKLKARGEATLVGLMTALAIGSVVCLGAASVFTFGINQFNLIAEQNYTEENLLMAAYYTRAYLSQAVKIVCDRAPPSGGALGAPRHINANRMKLGNHISTSVPYPPVQIAEGKLDCRPEAIDGNYQPGRIRPVAVFFREMGGHPPDANVGVAPALPPNPDVRATGIFFCAPGQRANGNDCRDHIRNSTGTNLNIADGSGVLFFSTAPAGGNLNFINGIFFDRIVDISVSQFQDEPAVPLPAIPPNIANDDVNRPFLPLRSASVRIIARYFKTIEGQRSYIKDPTKTVGMNFRDVEMVVPINFRNNWFKNDGTPANPIRQRLYGELYFYQFTGPSLKDMRF